MSAPAAIKGTFTFMRPVASRKIVQLIIELPIEHADAAQLALGGYPDPSNPKWVALARLNERAAVTPAQDGEDGPAQALPSPSAPKPKREWADVPPAEQAGQRCADPKFWEFLMNTGHAGTVRIRCVSDAALVVRTICGVASRTELGANHKARMMWFSLDEEFLVAMGRLAHHG